MILAATTGRTAEAVVFQDDMSDRSLSKWTPLEDGASRVSITQSSDPIGPAGTEAAHAPYLALSNSSTNEGVVRAELGRELTKDWKVVWKMLTLNPGHSGRAQFLAMLNGNGTQGYAVIWNTDEGEGNEGRVSLRKIDQTEEFGSGPGSLGSGQIGPSSFAGHEAFADETASFAEFELSWEAGTGRLTLKIDDVEKLEITDPSFSSFSRIYLRGNGTGLFDDIVVSTTASADRPSSKP